jgi:diketogulonate reductase-like aldo/keto reductase
MLREALAEYPGIFADQVEYHAKLSQHELREIAAEHDLLIEAYAPLGGSASDMIEVLLPRSTDPGRRRENLAALEVDLTGEETARIDELSERRERNFDPSFAPDWRD